MRNIWDGNTNFGIISSQEVTQGEYEMSYRHSSVFSRGWNESKLYEQGEEEENKLDLEEAVGEVEENLEEK